jgi:Tfp pilus assembly protein PilP
MPALLVAWQNQAQAMPYTRVSAWALRPESGEWATDRVPHFSLQLQTSDNAVQVLASSKPAQPTAQQAKPQYGGSAALYNPFNATWLSQGLPLRPRSARQVGLPEVELTQWHWLGALNAPGQSRALLSHEGRHFSVAVGQALGADGGEVVQVNKDHMQLLEWVVDAQGQWQSRAVRWPAKDAP